MRPLKTRPFRAHRAILATAFAYALLGLGGCTGGAQTPPTNDLQSIDDGAPAPERVTVHLENLASTVTGAQGDCDQVAAQLYGWTKGRQSAFPGLLESAKSERMETRTYNGYKNRIDGALNEVLNVVTGPCKSHAGVQAAFTEFDVLLDPPE